MARALPRGLVVVVRKSNGEDRALEEPQGAPARNCPQVTGR